MPNFRLWLPVTYDIDARAVWLITEKCTVLPSKSPPMLRDIVRVLSSNRPGRSVRASKCRPLPGEPNWSLSGNRVLWAGSRE